MCERRRSWVGVLEEIGRCRFRAVVREVELAVVLDAGAGRLEEEGGQILVEHLNVQAGELVAKWELRVQSIKGTSGCVATVKVREIWKTCEIIGS